MVRDSSERDAEPTEGYRSSLLEQPAAAAAHSSEPLDIALRNCNQVIARKPDYPEAYNARGTVLLRLMRYDDAVASFDRAIELKPCYPQAYNSRGNALQALRRFEEAVESYDNAIAMKADYAAAHSNRGNALQSLKRFEDAIESYGKAIALKPDYGDAYNNRGVALKRLERFDEALQNFETAIALLPGRAGLHNNRANTLQELKRFEDAIASYDTAIALSPDYPDAYSNRGVALHELKRFHEALEGFDRALALKEDYHEACYARALTHLLTGQFDIGWPGYEARKNRSRRPVGNRRWSKPLWLGETDISGKIILVDWEQGFGDAIQACRYIRLLENGGARVLFAPHKELQTLMQGLNANPHIVDLDADNPEFDLHCPLMSLPLAFKTDVASIASARYISADDEKVAAWKHRLGRKTKSRVGVVWRGNAIPDKDRSIELEQFQRLFDARCEFISLQKEVTEAERARLGRAGVFHAGDAFADFSDTAALCVLMDLVISIDTSVAHLAGALGIPVWVLLTWVPDWRWLLDRDDSPWYPSMRLFRQKKRGDWDGVLERLELELKAPIRTVRGLVEIERGVISE
jgi:tetratricopeptide (TPR) repeat protein